MLGLGAGCSLWRQGWAQGCLAGRAGGGPSLHPPGFLTPPAGSCSHPGGVKPPFPPSESYRGVAAGPSTLRSRAGVQRGGDPQCPGGILGFGTCPPVCCSSFCAPPESWQGAGNPLLCSAQLLCA